VLAGHHWGFSTQPQKGLNMKLEHQAKNGAIRVRAVDHGQAGPWHLVATAAAPRAVHVKAEDEKHAVVRYTNKDRKPVVRKLTINQKSIVVGSERPAAK
jgi:hypothetical protein